MTSQVYKGSFEKVLNRKIQISADALSQEIGGETVILDLASSTYFGIDEIGTLIWQMMKAGKSLQAIHADILSQYDVDPAMLEKDMLGFVEQLKSAGLVSVVQNQ